MITRAAVADEPVLGLNLRLGMGTLAVEDGTEAATTGRFPTIQ